MAEQGCDRGEPLVEEPGPARAGVGQVAGQGEVGDGVAALLAGPWELPASQGVLQAGVDLCEGKQFRPAGNARGQQAKQGAGECGVPLAGRGQRDGVRCGRGQEVGALDADLPQDGFLIAGLVGQGTPAETAVEDDYLLGGAAVGHHSSELVVGPRAVGQFIRISAGQAQEQLVAAAGPAMAGEIDQQRVLGARRMLAQRAVDLDRRGRLRHNHAIVRRQPSQRRGDQGVAEPGEVVADGGQVLKMAVGACADQHRPGAAGIGQDGHCRP